MIRSKAEIERYARRLLGVICDYPIECLTCADKPDLQDAAHSYGVEVVEDCYSNEKEATRFVSSIWHRRVSEIEPGQIKKLEKLGGSITEENGIVTSAKLGTTPNNPAHLIDTIKRKVEKLNHSGYETFASYGLYVIVDTVSLFGSYVQSTIEAIADYQNTHKQIFETIYLDGGFELCICDMKRKSFVRKPISREDKEKLWENM